MKTKKLTGANLQKILSVEAVGVAGNDYDDFLALINKLAAITGKTYDDAKARITSSRGQLADVVNTNALHSNTGNKTTILSGNDVQVFRSLLWRGGTAMRCEAPLITDSAHTRLIFAHTLLQQADLLTQRAQTLLATVKGAYTVSADDVTVLANSGFHVSANNATIGSSTYIKLVSDSEIEIRTSNNIKLIAQAPNSSITVQANRVDVNPSTPLPTVTPTIHEAVGRPGVVSKGKKHVQLPQWEGMSPIPAYVFPGDEVNLERGN